MVAGANRSACNTSSRPSKLSIQDSGTRSTRDHLPPIRARQFPKGYRLSGLTPAPRESISRLLQAALPLARAVP